MLSLEKGLNKPFLKPDQIVGQIPVWSYLLSQKNGCSKGDMEEASMENMRTGLRSHLGILWAMPVPCRFIFQLQKHPQIAPNMSKEEELVSQRDCFWRRVLLWHLQKTCAAKSDNASLMDTWSTSRFPWGWMPKKVSSNVTPRLSLFKAPSPSHQLLPLNSIFSKASMKWFWKRTFASIPLSLTVSNCEQDAFLLVL